MYGVTVESLERYKEYVGKHLFHEKFGEYYIKELAGRDAYLTGSHQYCIIHFINTGYEYRVRLHDALKGAVNDPYCPTIAGVGYIGEPDEVYDIRTYYIWNDMMDRNYNPLSKDYKNYGAKGVTVDPRWHCFANFLYDFKLLPGYKEYEAASELEKKRYQLDKDILQPGLSHNQKVYSKDTCIIVKDSVNLKEIHARTKIERDNNASKYLGVHKKPEGYTASISIDNNEYYLGLYDSEIAAANVYNYVATKLLYKEFNNGAPYMDIQEALNHYIGKNPIEFPLGIDMSNFNIPYRNHSKFYGVKKKRNNFYALYHNSEGSQHIGIYDDEIAAASAHNIYMRLKGDGVGHYNKESNNFHEMPLEEVMMHRTYTKATEPKVMIADIVDKNTNDLKWYTDYTYKSRYPAIRVEEKGVYSVRPTINGVEYMCGTYTSREAAITILNIIYRYYNLCYDQNDIIMSFEQAMQYKRYNSIPYWPPEFNPARWQDKLPLRVLTYPQEYYPNTAPIRYNESANACFNINNFIKFNNLLCQSTGESDEERKARVKSKYGIDFM